MPFIFDGKICCIIISSIGIIQFANWIVHKTSNWKNTTTFDLPVINQ